VGGTIGVNYQVGAFVFGAEGDFDWDNIKGNPSAAIRQPTTEFIGSAIV
jgi:hypothetical protein